MSRIEQFDQVKEADLDEEDEDEAFRRLWLLAGRWAQNLTLLGLMASACAILIYHL